jgi:FtsH-binding integral membrane protein
MMDGMYGKSSKTLLLAGVAAGLYVLHTYLPYGSYRFWTLLLVGLAGCWLAARQTRRWFKAALLLLFVLSFAALGLDHYGTFCDPMLTLLHLFVTI